MRITNLQKSELCKKITDFKLSEELFDIIGKNEFYQLKFKENDFIFSITMIASDKYRNTVTYINDRSPQQHEQNWHETIEQFSHWLRGISEEIQHSPKTIIKTEKKFADEIHKYSNSFVEIYNQALVAEMNGLTEICGLGYRKAFEFLIKDFLLKKHPKAEHDKIKKMLLGPCITQYVTSDEIKLVAHRVLWLGNDHAHYLKKWKGKTLDDLKDLIDLTVRWILIKDELTKVEKAMPKGK